jgi:hypothetical protein
MNNSTLGFNPDLRISPKPVLAALLALGCFLFLAAQMLSYPWQAVDDALSLLLLLTTLAIIGWQLVNWQPVLGRWFTVLALVVAVHSSGFWFGLQGSLVWAVIPVAMACSLLSLRAAALIAVGESLLVVFLARNPTAGFDPFSVGVALATVWAVFGAMCAAYYPLYQRAA